MSENLKPGGIHFEATHPRDRQSLDRGAQEGSHESWGELWSDIFGFPIPAELATTLNSLVYEKLQQRLASPTYKVYWFLLENKAQLQLLPDRVRFQVSSLICSVLSLLIHLYYDGQEKKYTALNNRAQVYLSSAAEKMAAERATHQYAMQRIEVFVNTVSRLSVDATTESVANLIKLVAEIQKLMYKIGYSSTGTAIMGAEKLTVLLQQLIQKLKDRGVTIIQR